MAPQQKTCSTRNVMAAHLGAKEYNPNMDQRRFYEGKSRVWTTDAKITASQIQYFLPELLFANSLLQQVCPAVRTKIDQNVDCQYRLAETLFTNSAINSTECTIHRDICFGLDVILYTGKWHGGTLRIPQLNIEIVLFPGDAVVMDSRLFHYVSQKTGQRHSLVFFTKNHHKTSKSGTLEVPESLCWLSQKNYGLWQ